MKWAIQAECLSKTYRNGTCALRGVNFEFSPGTAIAYLGPNGAGKTTTLNILATVLRPTSGTARVLGLDVVTRKEEVRSRIGLCPQEFTLDPLLTARENLMVFGRLKGLTGLQSGKRASFLAEAIGLVETLDRKTYELSWGQTKKLQICRELLAPPPVLLLDEPTSSLDPESVLAVLTLLRECVREGATLLVASHQMEDLEGRVLDCL